MAQWLKTDLKSCSDDLLLSETKNNSDILRKSEIREMIADHMRGRELNDKRIFALIMFQKWHDLSNRYLQT